MENLEIKKAIIPIAGLGTRFMPLSLVLSKEFFPLVDKPIVQYIVEEVKKSGIKEIVFVISPRQKMIINYFKNSPEVEKILVQRKKEKLLKELKDFEDFFSDILFSFVVQKDPMGDGHAILQAFKGGSITNSESVAVSFGDDIIYSDSPALGQLSNVFKTCGAPVIGLKQVPIEKVPAYGSVAVEKIANGLFKIKKIIEKPEPSQIKSNFVIVGKYVLTPDVFEYLKQAKPSQKGEIILGEVFDKMLNDGKVIYGQELKWEWLECGDKIKWLKSFFYLTLNNPIFGKEMKEYVKNIK